MKQMPIILHGEEANEEELAQVHEAWRSGVYQQLLFHVYSGLADEASTVHIARSLQSQFPEAHVVGTISAGEIVDGHLMPKGILISAMLFETTDVRLLRYDNVRAASFASAARFARPSRSSPTSRRSSSCFRERQCKPKGSLDS